MSTQLHSALATGVLLGIAYPSGIVPSWLGGWLMVIAYIPLLWAFLDQPDRHPKKWHLYVGMAAFHGIANWWVGSYQEQTDPFLLASGIALMIGHPLFLMLPWLVLGYLRKRVSATLALVSFPFVITAFEWIHGQSDASYPWLSAGYALIDTPLAQLADAIGVYGLGFILAAVNASIVLAIRQPKRRLVALLIPSTVIVAWIAYAVAMIVEYKPLLQKGSVGRLRVAMVQSNDNPWDKWSNPVLQVERTKNYTATALDSISAPIDLVVWPETAIPYPIRHSQYANEWLSLNAWVERRSIALLTGLSDLFVYPQHNAPPSARTSAADPTVRYDMFNAAALLSNDSVQTHYKSCLTPFAERLPFVDQLAFAQSWFQWGVGISSWGKGATRKPLTLRSKAQRFDIGVIICIESIYPDMVRDLVRNGATILCVITNDAWYNGTPGPRQHYNIARMRAIEQRRWLFRCALSGVTGIIAPDGTSVAELPEVSTGTLYGNVFNSSQQTLYADIGDVVPIGAAVVTLVLLLGVTWRSIASRRQALSQNINKHTSSTPSL